MFALLFFIADVTLSGTDSKFLPIYGFKNTKGIKICSHNVNRMESMFDETKNNLLQSKYPPDII